MTYVLQKFDLKAMNACVRAMRVMGTTATSMEDAANRIVNYLYDNLVIEETNERATALVRLFGGCPFQRLEAELQDKAYAMCVDKGLKVPEPDEFFMILLGTRGFQPAWNKRQLSVAHHVIPMREEFITPMAMQWSVQMGCLDLEIPCTPDPNFFIDLTRKTFNVFYIPEAVGSPYVPAQDDFAIRFGIRSLIGIGGTLPPSVQIGLIIFARVFVEREVAELFKPLATGLKLAMLPFVGGRIFNTDAASTEETCATNEDLEFENLRLRAQLALTADLLDVHEEVVETKTGQLEHAMSELNRSNTELQQFAYVASHDLNEPLRAVNGYLGLLLKRKSDSLDSEAQTYVTNAMDGAARMQALITDLLKYARVDSQGKQLVPTDCNKILEQAIANLKVAIDESGAVITRASLPTVLADDVQLTQLFQNLIANAIKFRKRDDVPRINISITPMDSHWVFAVQDSGIGMEMANADRVFVIFKRLHTRTAYPGTGIGLAICKRIVERHGGKIWVESAPDVGSTFTFTVPVYADDPPPT